MTAQQHYLVTLGVLFRWLKARKQVAEQQYAARVPVIAAQLAQLRGSYPG